MKINKDTWYMYWAGRYATSSNRLGPYIFRSDIGKEIPHYPDGRCFIDHGSVLEWHGQWFYAVSHGTESWSFRQSCCVLRTAKGFAAYAAKT